MFKFNHPAVSGTESKAFSQRRSADRAFTIVELIVAISIIALLISLILPAVQRSRETSRRTTCSSQLKQIGLAIHNYEASWKTFPQHDLDSSFLVHLLPYIDQGAILERDSPYHVVPEDIGWNRIARQTIALYQCPSDPEDREGGANYVGNFGYGYQVFGEANGVIVNRMRPLSFASVSDGLSQTAMISESFKGTERDSNYRSRIWRTPTSLRDPDQLEQFMQLCRSTASPSNVLPARLRVGCWASSLPDTIYTHTLYPNDVSCSNDGNAALGIYSAGSFHSNGVNLLHCDGHLKFIPTNIDLSVWRALGSRHGGESSVSEF